MNARFVRALFFARFCPRVLFRAFVPRVCSARFIPDAGHGINHEDSDEINVNRTQGPPNGNIDCMLYKYINITK